MLQINGRLATSTLNIDEILLDPNNPRFIGKKFPRRTRATNMIPEIRFAEPGVQEAALEKMLDEEFDVRSVRDSIRQNGFLPLDRIVVRPVLDKYVVVEGNRRIAAIKSLLKQVAEGEEDLTSEEVDSLKTLNVLVLRSPEDSIQHDQWLLQGIRHLSGIKDWGPYQKASLIHQMFQQGKTAQEIGASLGLTVVMVNRFNRTLHAIKQMEDDEEFGQHAGPELFTHFEEAYRVVGVRNYLCWDDNSKKFTNEERLKEFYSWIVPLEELNGERKLPRGKDVDFLDKVVINNNALSELRSEGKTISEALIKVGQDEIVEWKGVIEQALKTLEKLTLANIEVFKDEDFALIDRLVEEGMKRQKQAKAVKGVLVE
nr:ParB/Srx family N-terminal domain-containing protein [Paenibacillus xylanexedens]